MTSRSQKRPPSRVRLPLWLLGLLILGGLALLAFTSIWLFQTVQETVATFQVTDPDFSGIQEPVPNAPVVIETNGETAEIPAPISISTDSLQAWSGKERVTILMLGVDRRCDEEGPTHSDSLMLVTIDPLGLSASLLSLPRDLWVEIPGFELDRINQAYYLGQIYEYPGGGPALAMETVEAFLGINIDYYVAVDFQAFVEVVDLIGGIEINVPETIDDLKYPDQCYGYDPFHIEAGVHQLDGAIALKYARTRATFGGDVDRAARQQMVVLAVRDQIMQLNMLPQLITRAPELWQSLQENVRTNLTPEEAIQLALLMPNIPRDSFHTYVLDYTYLYNETTPDGRQVLVPVREEIRKLRDQIFVPPVIPTPVIENLPALAATEGARVAVYNGTAVFGLAAATQSYLQGFQINVPEIGNADASTYRTTQLIDYGSHPHTTRYLTQLMNIPPLNVSIGTNPTGEYDVLVIIGDDWRVPGSE